MHDNMNTCLTVTQGRNTLHRCSSKHGDVLVESRSHCLLSDSPEFQIWYMSTYVIDNNVCIVVIDIILVLTCTIYCLSSTWCCDVYVLTVDFFFHFDTTVRSRCPSQKPISHARRNSYHFLWASCNFVLDIVSTQKTESHHDHDSTILIDERQEINCSTTKS